MYKIGQQVVCVKTHSMGVTVEGQVYEVKGLHLCTCGYLSLDVGIKGKSTSPVLCHCGKLEYLGTVWLQGAKRFRPLDDLYNTEIEELMNEVNEKQPFEV